MSRKQFSLLVGMCAGVCLGLMIWSLWCYWQTPLPDSTAGFDRPPVQEGYEVPPAGIEFAVKDVAGESVPKTYLGTHVAAPSLMPASPPDTRCKQLQSAKRIVDQLDTTQLALSAHELFGVVNYPAYGIQDDRPRVGSFRVSDALAKKLDGITDLEAQLRVVAEFLGDLVEQGVDRDVAFLAASLDKTILDKMLDGRAVAEVTRYDLVPVSDDDGYNYWPDPVVQMVRTAADTALGELATCDDSGI